MRLRTILLTIAVSVAPPSATASGPWQNPYMSPNPGNNIHNDSYFSDTYAFPGPTSASAVLVSQLDTASFVDPDSGKRRLVVLGECGSVAFDADGNVQTICAGVPNPVTDSFTTSIVTIDVHTLAIRAYFSYERPYTSIESALNEFGGAGYFYQDDQYRMVVGFPNGHVRVFRRRFERIDQADGVDGYEVARDVNVTGEGGPIPPRPDGQRHTLYALMPDKRGNVWFSTSQGVVGTIGLDDTVRWYDTNDPDGNGTLDPQPDGGLQRIANSHAVDEGASADGPSGVYVVTSYRMYKLEAEPGSAPRVAWQATYDRGTAQKPGQVSWGSGSSPTLFNLGGHRFVTISDNATPMNVLVYRAETTLATSETRLAAQLAPFGDRAEVSNENSLVALPSPDGNSLRIVVENNWGYRNPRAVSGSGVTEPGLARVDFTPPGSIALGSRNESIRIPSIVTKASVGSNTVYTYEKRTDGWYLTALDADDLNRARFSTMVGSGQLRFNNHYSALALGSDGRTVWFGTLFGITRVVVQ